MIRRSRSAEGFNKPTAVPETGAKGERDDAGKQGELVPVRRQCAVRRGALRGLPRQPRLRPRQVARVLRRAAERPRHRRIVVARHGACAGRRVVRAARQGERVRQPRFERGPRGRAQAGLRPVADRRVPLARRALGRPRPAEAPGAAEDPRARARVLRPHRGRHGHGVQRDEHLLHDRRADDAARDGAGAARDVLRNDRRRVHALHRADGEALVAAAARVDSRQAFALERGEDPRPRALDRRRRARALSPHQVRRPEALLARGRRELHRRDGRVHPARRRQGRPGDRHRHGAPRPPQRARQHARQDAEEPVRRVRPHRAREPALGRRQVPPGLLERHHDAWRPGPPQPLVQPVAPRDRQPGRRGLGQGAPRPARRHRGRHGAAGDRPRRRRVRRPGRRHGDARARADAGLLHRRDGPHRHQQPDRLHDLGPARLALDALLHRRRQDDRGAGAARERRRSGGGRPVQPARARLPAGVQQGRRRRHRLLPQARPQRAGHAGADAAADVQEDRGAPGHAQALRRQARRPGRAAARRPRRDGQVDARRARRRQEQLRPGAHQLQEQVRGRLGAVPRQEVDRCRRHRAAGERAEAPRRADHDGAGRTSRSIRWSRRCSPTAPRWAAAR